jgi:hypothetical protein
MKLSIGDTSPVVVVRGGSFSPFLGGEKLDKSKDSIGLQKAACLDFGPQQPPEAEYFDALQ